MLLYTRQRVYIAFPERHPDFPMQKSLLALDMLSETARDAERPYFHHTPGHFTDSERGIIWPPISNDWDMLGFWPTCTTSSFCVLRLRHDELVKFSMISFCLSTDHFVAAQVQTSSAWMVAPINVPQTDRPHPSVDIISGSLSMTM